MLIYSSLAMIIDVPRGGGADSKNTAGDKDPSHDQNSSGGGSAKEDMGDTEEA